MDVSKLVVVSEAYSAICAVPIFFRNTVRFTIFEPENE